MMNVDARPPRVSIHAAARAAQHRGSSVDEEQLRCDPQLAARYRRAVMRLYRRSHPAFVVDETSGIWTNLAATRALVIAGGEVVTVVAADPGGAFGAAKIASMATRLRARLAERFGRGDTPATGGRRCR